MAALAAAGQAVLWARVGPVKDMTGAEFRCYRERLGLSAAWLADRLGVRERTIGRWEYGHQEIPSGVVDELWRLVDEADQLVDRARSSWVKGSDLLTFRTDREYRLCGGVMPASWHRAITARAAEDVDARIVYDGLTEESALD